MANKAIEKLKEKVKDKTVGILSHGKSIYELQEKRNRFKDLDICWASFNYYDLLDIEILHKMGEYLDIVLECAASRDKDFEVNTRFPRMMKYISLESIVISTWRLMRTQYEQMGIRNLYDDLLQKHTILADHILGELNVPNSLALLVYTIAVCEPKQIILFGVDGYTKKQGDEFATYFEPEKQKNYRQALLGGKLEYTLHETTADFEREFESLYKKYCYQLKVDPPKIRNCSPGTTFTKIPTVTYDELIKEFDNER